MSQEIVSPQPPAAAAPAKPKLLTRDEIFAAKDIDTDYVQVPEWGGTVKVRALSGDQIDAYQNNRLEFQGEKQSINTKKGRAQLVAMGCIDEQGNRVFNIKDVEALGKKSNKALERVADVIAKMSGLKKEEIKAAGEGSGDDPIADSSFD